MDTTVVAGDAGQHPNSARRAVLVASIAAVVLVPGTVIYLGLTWSSWNLLGLSELLPW
ncbi:hypothetical protein [Plantibacter flavus]|uniref:hypothetical protein n=1 Tax=Plantibacter flavus TaxID=150123 RepID=UPI001356662F|nr:hypothetical protein [Plantibacter flavus]